MPQPEVTVFIPTFFGEKYLRELLAAVFAQSIIHRTEVLIIDSGSTDETLNIVRDFPEIRLIQIPNSEFGHGKTRNVAAQKARGKFIAYLSQDAIPASTLWLEKLIQPLREYPQVAGVVGRQTPRANCVPMTKFEIEMTFATQGAQTGLTLYSRELCDWSVLRNQQIAEFYSDVNSATRRDFLISEISYRDVPYSEDMFFCRDFIAAGWAKAYVPEANVIHSNDLRYGEISGRTVDETLGLRRIGAEIPHFSRMQTCARIAKKSVGDSIRIIRDGDYSLPQKLGWLIRNPWYQLRKWRSYRRACTLDFEDSARIAQHSLEKQRLSGK